MPGTLDGIDVETITDIRERQRVTINSIPLGILPLQITQNLKGMIHQYEVAGVWSLGSTDYDNKKRKVENIQGGGLPIWFEATNWGKNQQIFGRISEFESNLREGAVDVWDWSFLVTAVLPHGFIFVRDDGTGDFRIYDLDRFARSRAVHPILRVCNWVKSATQITFSIFVKNIGGSTGTVSLEMMIPDGIVAADVTATGWTKTVGNVGTSGFSSVPGTKNRIKFDKSFLTGVEEQLDITIANISGKKTTYLDGSIDEEPG